MINLRKITEENFIDAFNLKLGDGQEKYVSHPVRSLAQAYVYRDQCQPFGIYDEDEMVGYVMVIYDYDIPEYDIWHMMIDVSHQGKGYGRTALEQVIAYIKTKPFGNSDRVTLTCNRNNYIAVKLYMNMGFSATGVEDEDEIEFSMMLQHYCDEAIAVRSMKREDADIFYRTFLTYGWHPHWETYENYFREQEEGKRKVFIAEYKGEIAGICTLVLNPCEGPFVEMGYAEIVDLNVFMHFRNLGIGNRLLDAAECEAFKLSDKVYLAVGVHSCYGQAQRIYVKRGYNFDGSGAWYQGYPLEQYAPCVNDDDLLLYMSKKKL